MTNEGARGASRPIGPNPPDPIGTSASIYDFDRKGTLPMARTENSADCTRRLAPPASLSDIERKVWTSLVKSVGSDHFKRCDVPLLAEYVRAAALCAKAAAAINQEGAVVNGKCNPWVTVAEKSGRALVALSARLRVCPQSRFDRLKAGTTAKTGAPELDDDGLLAK